jgi:N-acetylmuramoyl-L-alanine amidase
MKTIKIRQVTALSLFSIYLIVKICFAISIVYVTRTNEYYSTTQKYLYLLDAGHGYAGTDCNNKSVMDTETGECFYEWEFNWEVREMLSKKLDSAGIKYVWVNTDKKSDLPLLQRAKKVNKIHSNLKHILISIHANAAPKDADNFETASGFEVYSSDFNRDGGYPDKKQFSDTIAKYLYEEIEKSFPEHTMRKSSRTGSYKEASYTILSSTDCYAVLSENEFFTNRVIRKQMKTQNFKRRVATAHFNAIMRLESK